MSSSMPRSQDFTRYSYQNFTTNYSSNFWYNFIPKLVKIDTVRTRALEQEDDFKTQVTTLNEHATH